MSFSVLRDLFFGTKIGPFRKLAEDLKSVVSKNTGDYHLPFIVKDSHLYYKVLDILLNSQIGFLGLIEEFKEGIFSIPPSFSFIPEHPNRVRWIILWQIIDHATIKALEEE